MPELILVNEANEEVGTEEAVKCHLGDGILHRAFTIFVFNGKGDVLVQRRGRRKFLWPCFWEASCSGHPYIGDELLAKAGKRLSEELGISIELAVTGEFQYRAAYKDVGSENELCFVLTGNHDGEVRPDPREVSEYKWIEMGELEADIANNREQYAPWLIIGLDVVAGAR